MAKKKKLIRNYQGNHQRLDGTPLENVVAENLIFIIYETKPPIRDKKDRLWANVKVVAKDFMPHKGNFWLSFNITDLVFARNKDFVSLEQYHGGPTYDWIEDAMLEHYDKTIDREEQATLDDIL